MYICTADLFTVKTWEVKITLVLRPKEILPAISYPELRHIPVKLKKNSSGVTIPFFGHGESESEIYLHLYCSRVRGWDLRVWNLPYPSCVSDISKKRCFFVLKEAPQRPWTSWITGTVFKIHDHTFQISRLGRSCALATLQPPASSLTSRLASVRRRISK